MIIYFHGLRDQGAVGLCQPESSDGKPQPVYADAQMNIPRAVPMESDQYGVFPDFYVGPEVDLLRFVDWRGNEISRIEVIR